MSDNRFSRTSIDPAEWRLVGRYYQGTSEDIHHEYSEDNRELTANLSLILGRDVEAEGWPVEIQTHANTGCASCGAHYAHGAVFRNTTTGELIAVGQDCGANYFGVASISELKTRRAADWGRKARNQAKGEAFADEHDLLDDFKVEHHIIADIEQKLYRYGDLSAAQVELVHKIAAEEREYQARKAESEAKLAEVAALTPGRRQLSGTVVSTKWVDNIFAPGGGVTLKMLIELDEGNRLFGTVPAAILDDIDPGVKVTLTAEVQPSEDDPHFGFYKRPTGAEIGE